MSLSTIPYLKWSRRCLSTKKASELWSDPKAAAFLAAAKTVSSIPESKGLPEIIVTGRANVGKSTLLNCVLGRTSLLSTSKKPGHTKSLNFYRVGADPGKLLLVDAPGYGARGRREWGDLFDHYVQNRRELKRIYILFNAKHGLNDYDKRMLAHISSSLFTEGGTQPFTLQSIITKADTVAVDDLKVGMEKIRKDIWDVAPFCLPPIITSAEMKPHFGIDQIRKNIADACAI